MILVNGGLVILPHVCDDLGSAQSGHAGELLAESSNTRCKGITGKPGPTEECNISSHSVNKRLLARSHTAVACKKSVYCIIIC